jgi:hypothetical protein
MAKIFSAHRRDGLQPDRLPLKQALPLIAILSIASWIGVIGIIRLGRLLVGI